MHVIQLKKLLLRISQLCSNAKLQIANCNHKNNADKIVASEKLLLKALFKQIPETWVTFAQVIKLINNKT